MSGVGRVREWSWKLIGAWALMSGLAVSGIGEVVSGASAPAIGVVDDWGRIDEATGAVASWPYLLTLVVVFLLLHEVEPSPGARRVRGAAWALGLEVVVFIAASVIGAVATFERVLDASAVGGRGKARYYTDGERLGSTIILVALVTVAVLLWSAVVQLLRPERTTAHD